MIIASCTVPTLKLPASIARRRPPGCIETYFADVLGADEWVSCTAAYPHEDKGVDGSRYWLMLAVRCEHEIGDLTFARATGKDAAPMLPGHLFVVDPTVIHWLRPMDVRRPPRLFAALSWSLRGSRAAVVRRAREVVQQIGGSWFDADDIDKRYRAWRPQ